MNRLKEPGQVSRAPIALVRISQVLPSRTSEEILGANRPPDLNMIFEAFCLLCFIAPLYLLTPLIPIFQAVGWAATLASYNRLLPRPLVRPRWAALHGSFFLLATTLGVLQISRLESYSVEAVTPDWYRLQVVASHPIWFLVSLMCFGSLLVLVTKTRAQIPVFWSFVSLSLALMIWMILWFFTADLAAIRNLELNSRFYYRPASTSLSIAFTFTALFLPRDPKRARQRTIAVFFGSIGLAALVYLFTSSLH